MEDLKRKIASLEKSRASRVGLGRGEIDITLDHDRITGFGRGAIPKHNFTPDMPDLTPQGARRITFSPSPIDKDKHDVDRVQMYENTYLGDQFETPDVPREWDAFVTRREPRVSTPLISERGSHPLPRNPTHFRTENVTPADNSATLRRPNKPITIPMCYDGKQLDIRDWLSNFEGCKIINQWSDDESTCILPTYLRAQALQLYNDMTSEEKRDYKTLKETLIQKFDPVQDPGVYLSQLHGMSQGSYKSLQQLSSAVFRLVAKAYPTIDADSKQKMSIQYFIDALSDSEVQKQVRRLSPKTLASAVDLALREESYVALEKKRPRIQSVTETDVYSEMSKQLTELKEQVAQLSVSKSSEAKREAKGESKAKNTNVRSNYLGNRNQNRGRGRGYDQNRGRVPQYAGNVNPYMYDPSFSYNQTQNWDQGCWYCGDPGHFKRDCPYRPLNP